MIWFPESRNAPLAAREGHIRLLPLPPNKASADTQGYHSGSHPMLFRQKQYGTTTK